MPKCQLKWSVEWIAPITLAALTTRLFEDGLGRADLVALLEARSRELVEMLCGPWYRPVKDGRFRRAGTKKRKLGTRFGIIRVRVHRVKDLATGTTFVPLWWDVLIEPRRVYQPDVVAVTEQFVERMTYRNTSEELGKVIKGVPSAPTINRRVIEDGGLLNEEINQREIVAGTIQSDGTKLHAQKAGSEHHDVNITLATDGGKNPRLRCLTVGRPWQDHVPPRDRTLFFNPGGEPVIPTLMSDMERGLASLMTPPDGAWLPDHVHVVRNTKFALWDDGMTNGEEKRKIVRTVSGLLAHLRNSVNLHLPRGEIEAIEHRIKQTTKEFRRLATNLLNDGLVKTASFLRRMSNAVTTWATLRLLGMEVPWHNNLVERLMGEVSKRGKHKWMSWTSHGGQALLTLLVVRTIEPDTHEMFWNRKLYGPLNLYPDLGVQVTPLGAEC